EKRLKVVIDHPFLMPPLSLFAFAQTIGVAALMPDAAWQQWIEHPMNADIHMAYMIETVLPYFEI
ncbi:MAG: hypothetical protein Q8K36_03200, partial [Alphaproteobacteria bacterium]|nr:hypothetical protein [Alphaproteobacteria bacterium]